MNRRKKLNVGELHFKTEGKVLESIWKINCSKSGNVSCLMWKIFLNFAASEVHIIKFGTKSKGKTAFDTFTFCIKFSRKKKSSITLLNYCTNLLIFLSIHVLSSCTPSTSRNIHDTGTIFFQLSNIALHYPNSYF